VDAFSKAFDGLEGFVKERMAVVAGKAVLA
jgi:hypothetical protein